jgi:hypothetical protein
MNHKSGLVWVTLAIRLTAIFLWLTMVKVGNGEKEKFWTSPWIDGIFPKGNCNNSSKYHKAKISWLEKLCEIIFG